MKLLTFALLAVGLLLLAGCAQNEPAKNPKNEAKNNAKIDAPGKKLAVEGEFCGGIAGIGCEAGLKCEILRSYPDAGGKCVKTADGWNGSAGLANPASTHCVELGGEVKIFGSPEGQYGGCEFANGTICEEWELFRSGKCQIILAQEDAYDAAQQYAKITMTYAFDGSKLQSRANASTGVGKYAFEFSFESSHGGYGDRNGQLLTQAVVQHRIIIVVEGDRIVSAVTDGKYDEMGKKEIQAVTMTQQMCESSGGRWNECASACRNNPKAEICTMQCVQICECGGNIRNAPTCPLGWKCQASPAKPEGEGECVPE